MILPDSTPTPPVQPQAVPPNSIAGLAGLFTQQPAAPAPAPQLSSGLDPAISAAVMRAVHGYLGTSPIPAAAPAAPAQGAALGGEGTYGGDDYAHAGWGTAQPFDYAAAARARAHRALMAYHGYHVGGRY